MISYIKVGTSNAMFQPFNIWFSVNNVHHVERFQNSNETYRIRCCKSQANRRQFFFLVFIWDLISECCSLDFSSLLLSACCLKMPSFIGCFNRALLFSLSIHLPSKISQIHAHIRIVTILSKCTTTTDFNTYSFLKSECNLVIKASRECEKKEKDMK